MKRKSGRYIAFAIIFIFIGTNFVNVMSCSVKDENEQKLITNQSIIHNQISNGYTNITVYEAWDMLNSTEDGYQILIDMRRFSEYITERIDSPDPNNPPRWYPYEFTSDGPGPIVNEGLLLKLFMLIYQDKEIIIYCRTARRTGLASQILVDNGFEGIIYNMQGGITEWKAAGFPTVEGLFP